MRTIDLEKWGKYTGREPLCSLPLSVNEFAQRTGIALDAYEEEAGKCYCGFVQIRQCKYFIQGFVSRDCKKPPVAVDMEGNNADPGESLSLLLSALGLEENDLHWLRGDLSPPGWGLYRQGEDGNEVEVSRYFSESAATWVMKQFAGAVHKQSYVVRWIG